MRKPLTDKEAELLGTILSPQDVNDIVEALKTKAGGDLLAAEALVKDGMDPALLRLRDTLLAQVERQKTLAECLSEAM